MQAIRIDPAQTLCLDVLKTLCRIFWGPDLSLCREIMNGVFVKLLQDASDVFKADLSSSVMAAARLGGEYKDVEALCAALSDGYIALFVNDIKGISSPLYHSCYLASGSRLMGASAIEMNRRIERHGLSCSLPGNEPADHLSIELEYLYYLLKKGWTESSGDLVQEAAQFSRDSMDGWVRCFHDRISADGRFPFYTGAAQLLCALVRYLSDLRDQR